MIQGDGIKYLRCSHGIHEERFNLRPFLSQEQHLQLFPLSATERLVGMIFLGLSEKRSPIETHNLENRKVSFHETRKPYWIEGFYGQEKGLPHYRDTLEVTSYGIFDGKGHYK